MVLPVERPRVNESSVNVSLDDNVLTIRSRAAVNRSEGFELVHSEWQPIDFERAFTISNDVDCNGIGAAVRNGVLTLRLPKAEEARLSKIRIKTE